MDDFKKNHDKNVQDVKMMKTSVSKVANDLEDNATELRQEIKNYLSDVREETEELKESVLDLKCRSMKNNLICTGIPETENENTENVVIESLLKTIYT